MKIRLPKKQSAREGLVFVAMFVVTAGGIGLYQFIHANPLDNPTTQNLPATSSEQLKPFYSIYVTSARAVSFDQTNQTKQVTVNVNIINPSDKPMQISPGLQMLLVDTNGVSYPMTAKYLPVGKVVGGQLNAKSNKAYSIDFELPANATAKTFSFQLDASYNPIQVDI